MSAVGGALARSLHLKLAGFYALYYVAVGIFVPFWPLYLHSLGYSPTQIGGALAATGLVRVAVPVGWGWVMDRSGRRMPWIGTGMLVSALLFSAVPFAPNYAALVLLHVLYAIFWNAALPAFDVVTLNHLAHTGTDYTRVRLWGSIGFIVSVAAMGPLLDLTGVAPVPWLILVGMLAIAWLSFHVPDVHDHRAHDPAQGGFLRRVRTPAVIALLAAAFLSQLSFAPYYAFFSIYLDSHGYDRTAIGAFWALGVASEVVVFIYTGRIIRRFGARTVLVAALLSTAARWAMLALFVDSALLLSISQVLHLMSFGVYHAVTVHYVHELFPGRLQGRGQALLAAVSFGLGGAVGALASGDLWERLSPETVFFAAAACALLGAWIARFAPTLR